MATIVISQPTPAGSSTISPKNEKKKRTQETTVHIASDPGYYGCDHVKHLLQARGVTTKKWYAYAVRLLGEKTNKITQKCTGCSAYKLTSNFLCIQCAEVNCKSHAKHHMLDDQSHHGLGVDSQTGDLYCFFCQDYIQDPTLERVKLEKEAFVDGNPKKRRKIEEFRIEKADDKFIETNSAPPPCRAMGLRGLINLGQTCFLNTVLQAIVHNPLHRNYFFTDGHKSGTCSRTHCLGCNVEELFRNFYTADAIEAITPHQILIDSWRSLKDKDPSRRPELAGYKQHDAHEFLQFILEELHHVDPLYKEDANCPCIVHRAYYGLLQSDVRCSHCGAVSSREEPMMDLSLGLREMDLAHAGSSGSRRKTQSLESCLRRFVSEEKLSSYKCDSCKSVGATKNLSVKRLPPVLMFQLKRFEHSKKESKKLNDKVAYPLHIDMSPFTTRQLSRRPAPSDTTVSCQYNLQSVIQHTGGSLDKGHYVAYAREDDGRWFKYDDAIVTVAAERDVLGACGYLLFYVRSHLS